MRKGVPSNKNRFFPVRKSTQRKPCSGPVLALYGIAVWLTLRDCILIADGPKLPAKLLPLGAPWFSFEPLRVEGKNTADSRLR